MGFHRDSHEPALAVPHSCAEALRAVPEVHEMMIWLKSSNREIRFLFNQLNLQMSLAWEMSTGSVQAVKKILGLKDTVL